MIDGEPIADEAVADATGTRSRPFVDHRRRRARGARATQPLTFFEALTVLAFARFADAPVDVLVLEVGMGGEWDSTNVADGQVAVFTPDRPRPHAAARLDRSPRSRAPSRASSSRAPSVVSAKQADAALEPCSSDAAELTEATLAFEGDDVRARVDDGRRRRPAHHGARARGRRTRDVYLPLYGDHQAPERRASRSPPSSRSSAAARSALAGDVARRGPRAARPRPGACSSSASTRRCSSMPRTTRTAPRRSPPRSTSTSTSTRSGVVLGVLADKDAAGIVAELAPRRRARLRDRARLRPRRATPTASRDLRARRTGCRSTVHDDARRRRRGRARVGRGVRSRAVVVTGSVALAGEAIALAAAEDWKAGWTRVTDAARRAAPRPRRRARRSPESLALDRARVRVDRRLPRRPRDLRPQGAARADRRRGGALVAGVGASLVLLIATTGAAAVPVGHRARLGAAGARRSRRASSSRRCSSSALLFGGLWCVLHDRRRTNRSQTRDGAGRSGTGTGMSTWPSKRPSCSSSPTASRAA